MIDPISVISSVCLVISTFNSTFQLWSDYCHKRKERRENSRNQKDDDPLSSRLETGSKVVQERYNKLVVEYGSKFVNSADEKFRQDVMEIKKQQEEICDRINKLQKPVERPKEEEIRHIAEETKKISDAMTQALQDLLSRVVLPYAGYLGSKDYEESDNNGMPVSKVAASPRTFCFGAILVQNDKSQKGSALAIDQRLHSLGFTCKYCNLEVGDYRMSSRGQTLISARLLAASHVTSCASFSDRRAFYKCLACYDTYRDVDFCSPSTLQAHMETHPGYDFGAANAEVEDIAKELNIKIRTFEKDRDGEPLDNNQDKMDSSSIQEISSDSASDINTAKLRADTEHNISEPESETEEFVSPTEDNYLPTLPKSNITSFETQEPYQMAAELPSEYQIHELDTTTASLSGTPSRVNSRRGTNPGHIESSVVNSRIQPVADSTNPQPQLPPGPPPGPPTRLPPRPPKIHKDVLNRPATDTTSQPPMNQPNFI